MTKFDQRNQNVSGDQHNAGRDINIFDSDFLSEKSLTAQLMVSLIIQAIVYGCTILASAKPDLPLLCACYCAPFFSLHALYSLFMGYQSKNKNVILMSIIAGVAPFLALAVSLLFTYYFLIFPAVISPPSVP